MEDFLIPFEQIQIVRDELSESKILNGKWFNGLAVQLYPRAIHTEYDMKKLLYEIKILKNIRHPNIEMTLGVTFEKNTKILQNKRVLTYNFYIVT